MTKDRYIQVEEALRSAPANVLITITSRSSGERRPHSCQMVPFECVGDQSEEVIFPHFRAEYLYEAIMDATQHVIAFRHMRSIRG